MADQEYVDRLEFEFNRLRVQHAALLAACEEALRAHDRAYEVGRGNWGRAAIAQMRIAVEMAKDRPFDPHRL